MKIGVSIGIGRRRASNAFDPASLFAGGEQGILLDINPTTTGVSAGSTVTTANDTSGRGNNATQGTAGLRPTLQTEGGRFYLDFTGGQGLSTSAINMGARDEITIIAGVRKTNDNTGRMLLEASANSDSAAGSFQFLAPLNTFSSGDYGFSARGDSFTGSFSSGTFLAPDLAVITATADISAASRTIRRNGVQVATSSASMGAGNFGNHALFIGSRNNASLFFDGRLYGLIVINRLLTTEERALAEAWMATKTGVTL